MTLWKDISDGSNEFNVSHLRLRRLAYSLSRVCRCIPIYCALTESSVSRNEAELSHSVPYKCSWNYTVDPSNNFNGEVT